jgi:hypothetical protein
MSRKADRFGQLERFVLVDVRKIGFKAKKREKKSAASARVPQIKFFNLRVQLRLGDIE